MFIPLRDIPEIVISDNLKDKIKYKNINEIGAHKVSPPRNVTPPRKKNLVDEAFFDEVEYMDKLHQSLDEITTLLHNHQMSDAERNRLFELYVKYETAKIVYENYKVKMNDDNYENYAYDIRNNMLAEYTQQHQHDYSSSEEDDKEEYIQRGLYSLIK